MNRLDKKVNPVGNFGMVEEERLLKRTQKSKHTVLYNSGNCKVGKIYLFSS